MTAYWVWVLGPASEEMDSIESYLRSRGQRIAYATRNGERSSQADCVNICTSDGNATSLRYPGRERAWDLLDPAGETSGTVFLIGCRLLYVTTRSKRLVIEIARNPRWTVELALELSASSGLEFGEIVEAIQEGLFRHEIDGSPQGLRPAEMSE